MRKGISKIADLADGNSALGDLMAAGGKWYYCNPSASVFGDGLSFDQRNKSPDNIVSSKFAKFDRGFEPYDRLLFTTGQVDPLTPVSFQFLITDYTPRWTFYLVQDPRIPST